MNSNVLAPDGQIEVSADVINTGDRDGEIVAQLYVRDIAGSVTRPVKELRGFEKVFLRKGEVRTVHFTLTPQLIAMYNPEMKRVAEPGEFKVWIATNAADERLEGIFSYEVRHR